MARLKRRPWKQKVLAGAAALGVGLGAVGGLAVASDDGDANEAVPVATTRRTTTTRPSSAPLTGLPQPDPALLARPALVLKIDNDNQKARPQVGLDHADVVYEEVVEGGATRFAAVFQSTDSDPVGPVRSARTTDVQLVANLAHPLFGYAGANGGVLAQVRAAPLFDRGWNALPGEYWRERGRPAPNNLFTNTSKIFEHAPPEARAPAPLFSYREPPEALPSSARAVPGVAIHFGGSVALGIQWTWDAASATWKRDQAGTPHTMEDGTQLAAANVVIQFVQYHDSGFVDVSGAESPEAVLVGEGEVWVLTAGRLIGGRWTRATPDGPTVLTDAAGRPIELTPGRTWVELPRSGQAAVSKPTP